MESESDARLDKVWKKRGAGNLDGSLRTPRLNHAVTRRDTSESSIILSNDFAHLKYQILMT